MIKLSPWFVGALFVVGALIMGPHEARAQTIFCPSAVVEPSAGTNNPGIQLNRGACTNPLQANGTEVGAFSGAALAGQAVGNLVQSMSVVQTAATGRQIEQRRTTEAQTCAPGEALVDGICRPVSATPLPAPRPQIVARPTMRRSRPAQPNQAATPKPEPRRSAQARRVKPTREVNLSPEPVVAPVPTVVSPIIPAHFSAWAQGYGDYEERSGRGLNQIQCCTNIGAIPLNIDATSRTRTAGFIGGIDWTTRNVFNGGDGLIIGLSTGYLDSEVKVNTSLISTSQPSGVLGVGNGYSRLRAHLSGPSIGAYATYFSGPWSNDILIKNDFLSLNESFDDLQAYQTCSCFPAFASPYSGKGHTSLDQFTVADNLNYRIPVTAALWIEPTGGIQYTHSSYGSDASSLGLADGDLVRIQGGSRIGGTTILDNVAVTASLTGLAYDNVVVTGNFVQGGVFSTSGRILNDQGKLRGEGILNVAFDFGNGRSAFMQGDVRGGDALFGAGGRAGFRLQW